MRVPRDPRIPGFLREHLVLGETNPAHDTTMQPPLSSPQRFDDVQNSMHQSNNTSSSVVDRRTYKRRFFNAAKPQQRSRDNLHPCPAMVHARNIRTSPGPWCPALGTSRRANNRMAGWRHVRSLEKEKHGKSPSNPLTMTAGMNEPIACL